MIEEAAYGRMDSYTCTEPGDEEPSRCRDEHQSALRVSETEERCGHQNVLG